MKKIIIYTILLFFIFKNNSNAQTDPILLKLAAEDSIGVQLHWFPRDANTFWRGIKSGYTITRSDETGKKEVLSKNHLPRPKDFWEKYPIQEDSFYQAIGKMIYNTNLNNTEDKSLFFNYLANEASFDINLATEMGLAFTDSTAYQGKRYIYTLSFKDNDEEAAKGLLYFKSFATAESAKNIKINYDLKGNKSLRDQRPQNNRVPDMILVQSKAYEDSIVLRFAPNNELFWSKTNRLGYTIYRRSSDGKYDSLTFIKPWNVEKFSTPQALADPKTTIVAECIYGNKTVKAEEGLFGKKTDLEMRFGMTMLVVEQSVLAADAAGLRFVDKNVKKGENYTYYISSKALSSPFGEGITSLENTKSTAQTSTKSDAIGQEKKIILRWQKENAYSAYRIERSEDDKKYQIITDAPLVFIENESQKNQDFYTYSDSVGINYKRFYYRIQGLNSFGEWVILTTSQGMAEDVTPPAMPTISFGEHQKTGIEIRWEYGKIENDFSHFEVLLAKEDNGTYEKMATKLPSSQRQFLLKNPIASNRAYYFKVVAVDTAGNISTSISKFVVVIDSVPPAAPKGLVGKIDSNGVLHITWQPNKEEDLIGYRIYGNDNPIEEFIAIRPDLLRSNSYFDTINVRTLNHKMYFKVIAEDFLNNKSDFSQMLIVEKPDLIPPVCPILHATKATAEGVILSWEPSSSDDVVKNVIYRCVEKDSIKNWTILTTTTPYKINSFTDTTAQIEQIYLYSIQSFDKVGNASERSFSVNGRRFFGGKGATIQGLNGAKSTTSKNIDLTWDIQKTNDAFLNKQDYYYFVYRAKGKAELAKYSQLTADTRTFSDDEATDTGVYRYALRVVYQDGKMSDLSKEIVFEVK
jgi:uncharacterized protein